MNETSMPTDVEGSRASTAHGVGAIRYRPVNTFQFGGFGDSPSDRRPKVGTECIGNVHQDSSSVASFLHDYCPIGL